MVIEEIERCKMEMEVREKENYQKVIGYIMGGQQS